MANVFGLNGYLIEVTPKGSDFEAHVWQPDYPENKTSVSVKASDLDGKTWDERGVMEKVLAPVWKELDDVRAKHEREEQDKELKDRQEREARELEARNDYLANTTEAGDRPNLGEEPASAAPKKSSSKK